MGLEPGNDQVPPPSPPRGVQIFIFIEFHSTFNVPSFTLHFHIEFNLLEVLVVV
jgi:hypothetical protein